MQNSQSLVVMGMRLEVQQIAGDASLASIVFLHEGLGSVAMWRDWPAKLCAATGRRGVVYSRRGYGQSEAIADLRHTDGTPGAGALQPNYMHREAFEVLPALLQALGLDSPVLCGHSDGATIGLLHASQWPCTAIVAMAPHLFVESIALHAIAQARIAYTSGDLQSRLVKYHADADCAFWQWNDIWLSPAFQPLNIAADCARIACPVLGIQGWQDAYGTMAQLETLQKSILQPHLHHFAPMSGSPRHCSLLKLEQCGHSPHKDQTQACLDAIQIFLSQSGLSHQLDIFQPSN